MKFLLFILSIFPIAAQSQIGVSGKIPIDKREISLNLGYAPDNAFESHLDGHGGYIRSAISLLRNKGHIQYGVTIEGGTNSDCYWYLAPAVLLNRTFSRHKAYFYAGAMAGYVCSDDMMKDHFVKQRMAQGYVFGFQGGFVQPIGKNLSLNGELAVRSTQLWTTFRIEEYETVSNIILYFPATIGLRYRF